MAGRFALKLATWLRQDQVEVVLKAACKNPYQVTLAGVEETDDGPRKIMKLSFETAEDRERFKLTFQQHRDKLSRVKV